MVRWVITQKVVDGKVGTKARLVVRGFEENTSNLQKDSPTCSREAIRILIAIASSKQWVCHTVDVKLAYLQGDKIQRTIFLKPPQEYDNGQLWKLKKTVYGLCDAARAWYMKIKRELLSMSVELCTLDNSLFISKEKAATRLASRRLASGGKRAVNNRIPHAWNGETHYRAARRNAPLLPVEMLFQERNRKVSKLGKMVKP